MPHEGGASSNRKRVGQDDAVPLDAALGVLDRPPSRAMTIENKPGFGLRAMR